MKSTFGRWWLVGALLLNLGLLTLVAEPAPTHPLLHPLFHDHAVLQRGVRVPVWGWTEPGAKVTVSFAGQKQSAVADATGRWEVRLKSMKASTEPRTLTVTTTAPSGTVQINDVLVGDVWLCSGQSNMEMGIGMCDVPNDIAAANFPQIRLLTVPHHTSLTPVDTLECQWLPCSPQNVMQGNWGGFSATAFYFGRKLHQELGVPIGLLHSSWGGTIAEAWTSAEALKPLGDFNGALEQVQEMARDPQRADYPTAYARWCRKNDPGTQQNWQQDPGNENAWRKFTMPQPFEKIGLQDFDGMVWFRREFEVPESWAGQELKLELGAIDDYDSTWMNGVLVGQTYLWNGDRQYVVPAGAVHAGKNVLTVRVMDTGGLGGMTSPAEKLRLTNPHGSGEVSLAGDWQVRESLPLANATPPPALDGGNPNVVTYLYNGMIAPLLPYAIKGAIWYQGESNAERAAQYQRLLPTMIADWRARFGVGNFPFYIVQLAAWQATNATPRNHPWAELREAQAWTAQHVKNCGLAVAIDVGDANDIHPKDKRNVGLRLAANALAKTYGQKLEYSGPEYRSMKVSGNSVRLKFNHVGKGLVARGPALTGFAIAGADRKFVWAEAKIDGQTVVVSAPTVPAPVAVRYAWDINPLCNLYNEAGLPAGPFRTDHWTK